MRSDSRFKPSKQHSANTGEKAASEGVEIYDISMCRFNTAKEHYPISLKNFFTTSCSPFSILI